MVQVLKLFQQSLVVHCYVYLSSKRRQRQNMYDSNMLFAIYLLLMCSLCHGILLENRKQCKIHFVVQYTIPSFKVLLCLNQSPESIYLLPLQLIEFCSDMMADKVQLFGQLTLLYHESILDSKCQHLGVIPAHRNTNK